MNIQKLIAAVVVFAAAGSAFAQQTEFVAPDAGFTPTLTRAKVHQGVMHAASQGKLVRQQYTGQDPVYAKSQRSRAEVRTEAVQSRRAGDINNLYFGA